jgi:hypothetical protein
MDIGEEIRKTDEYSESALEQSRGDGTSSPLRRECKLEAEEESVVSDVIESDDSVPLRLPTSSS